MLVHFTLIKVSPGKVQDASRVLTGSNLLEYFLNARGLCHASLSSSIEEPGKLLSLSMWESPAAAQAVFADPNYAVLIGELRILLIAAPTRTGYNLLQEHHSRDLPVEKNLFIHNTIVTVAPENTQNLIAVLYSEKVTTLLDTIEGFIMSYAFESPEEPGRIVSMSWWDSAAVAQTTFARPEYAGLLGDMRPYFIKAPERQGYQLLSLVRHDQK